MIRNVGRRGALLASGWTLYAGLGAGQGRAAGMGQLAETVPPRALPELRFLSAQGVETQMSAFRGQGLLVNLWATWCGPCVAEMPALNRAQAALAAEGVKVLALSSDRGGGEVVERFYGERGVTHLGVWLDPRGAAGRALGVRGLPTTVVVDRNGLEVARLEGAAEWDMPEMLARVRRLVGPPVVGTQAT